MEKRITDHVLDLLSLTGALPFELRMRLVDQEVRELQEKEHEVLDPVEGES